MCILVIHIRSYVTQFWKTLQTRTLLDFKKYSFEILKVV